MSCEVRPRPTESVVQALQVGFPFFVFYFFRFLSLLTPRLPTVGLLHRWFLAFQILFLCGKTWLISLFLRHCQEEPGRKSLLQHYFLFHSKRNLVVYVVYFFYYYFYFQLTLFVEFQIKIILKSDAIDSENVSFHKEIKFRNLVKNTEQIFLKVDQV